MLKISSDDGSRDNVPSALHISMYFYAQQTLTMEVNRCVLKGFRIARFYLNWEQKYSVLGATFKDYGVRRPYKNNSEAELVTFATTNYMLKISYKLPKINIHKDKDDSCNSSFSSRKERL